MKGAKTSEVITKVLKDLALMKKPHTKVFTRKNDLRPFEADDTQTSSLEFLCEKNDAGLFVMGNHNKKRPHNLILGRTFNDQLLDMIEFGVKGFISMEEHQKMKTTTHVTAFMNESKPCIVFQGDEFANA